MSDPATSTTPPTLEMVAARAGVSRSTVSRVVNGSPQVTPEVLAAVKSAIAELNYIPNRAARSLASRRTHTIALVIPENTAKFFSDPYFASVIRGAATFLAGTEYTLTLVIASEMETEKTRRYLSGGNIDGALVMSHHSDRAYIELSRSLPVVFAGRPMNPEGGNCYIIDIDNVAAGRIATRNLLDHGRTRIATVAGPQDMAVGIDRVQGWREELAEAGLDSSLAEYGDFTPVGGADAMRRLLDRGVAFDGLFVANAQMASGAIGVLRERGLSIPGDVGITTIDNDYYATSSNPPLTTIEQPTVEQGSAIADLLVRLIAGEDVPSLTIMPATLIERESV